MIDHETLQFCPAFLTEFVKSFAVFFECLPNKKQNYLRKTSLLQLLKIYVFRDPNACEKTFQHFIIYPNNN